MYLIMKDSQIVEIEKEIAHLKGCIGWQEKYFNNYKYEFVTEFNKGNRYIALDALNNFLEARENIKKYKKLLEEQETLLESFQRRKK